MWELMWKTTKAKKAAGAGDVAQVVEHLPSKCAALSSNSGNVDLKKSKDKSKCLRITMLSAYISLWEIDEAHSHIKYIQTSEALGKW
jgi:hypothetical protein